MWFFKKKLSRIALIFRSVSGTSRGVKIYEQEFLVSDSINCLLPVVVYTRLSNRNILTWIQNVTGNLRKRGNSKMAVKVKATFLYCYQDLIHLLFH
jgi:hypothetical protein